MAVTIDAFRRQLDFLQDLGPIVSLNEGLGGAGLRFSLTFDDGYQDNLTVLLPELERRGIHATVYVTTAFVEGGMPAMPHDRDIGYHAPALTQEELRTLAESTAIDIGAHGHNHLAFKGLSDDEWRSELGKGALESMCGQRLAHFAYTYGPLEKFDWEKGPLAVQEAGYRTLASNAGGWNTSLNPQESPVHLRRVPSIASSDRSEFLGWVFRQAQRNIAPSVPDL